MTPSQAAMDKAREICQAHIRTPWSTDDYHLRDAIAAAIDEAAQERDAVIERMTFDMNADRKERDALRAEVERLKQWQDQMLKNDGDIPALRARLARCEAVVEAAKQVQEVYGDDSSGIHGVLYAALAALDEKESP